MRHLGKYDRNLASRLPPQGRPLAVSFLEGSLERCEISLRPHASLLSLTTRKPYAPSVRRIIILFGAIVLGMVAAFGQETNTPSRVIEAAGRVEFAASGSVNWRVAATGFALNPGDRLRTGERSRAAVQLSDRSVIRLDERTTLEILPPRRAEKRRFGLRAGALYFFNREKPAEVEFETPVAAGAIRGTEFLLEAMEPGPILHLALIDGRVSLQADAGEINLARGEDLLLEPGRPPLRSLLANVAAKIQWALYYPAVVIPEELAMDPAEITALGSVLANYKSGDLLGALAAWPVNLVPNGAGAKLLRAQLDLAVGRVNEAESLLSQLPQLPAASALRTLLSVVRNDPPQEVASRGSANERRASRASSPADTPSEQLALSYALQARAELHESRAAARRAVALAPGSGFAHARLAELEFAFGERRAALAELTRALELSPRLVSAHSLRGFVLLEQGRASAALDALDRARSLDAGFGPAWLGRGLVQMNTGKFAEARSSFQASAALEPQRGLFRSYLGKAASELGDRKGADKEFHLAQQLDPNDPTAWLYQALHLWQENQLNEAIRALETSSALNDNQSVFRSRLLLDQDHSVRSANLAAIYDEAGLTEASRRAASQAVGEDYANFSGHLFLANAYQVTESAERYDLRLETARQSELLVANLLAPPGGGNLSQVLSEQERLRFFGQQPVGLSSLTTYGSRGDWNQTSALFGSVDGFSYAFDSIYDRRNGQRLNNDSEQRVLLLTAKQRLTPDDEAYLQIGDSKNQAGDLAMRYDPAQANPRFRVDEEQDPNLYAGWHHSWSPGVHSLFLASRLDDRLAYRDPQAQPIFLVQSGGVPIEIQHPPLGPLFTNDFSSRFILYSLEAQQVFESDHRSLVAGGRWQRGDVSVQSRLSRVLSGPITDQHESGGFDRGDLYGYYTYRPVQPLRLTAGLSYSRIGFPENTDLPPISFQQTTRDQVSPKAGLQLAPWSHGLLRASYTRSLGGLFFDNSIRLEPTQVGGLNQAFRSSIPESVAGLLPGAGFETAGAAFDQSFSHGTYIGIGAEWLTSHGSRTVGVLTNATFLPIPDSPGSARQSLSFRERNLNAYAAQLLGNFFSAGARYRLSEATLSGQFPEIPAATPGLDQLNQYNRAVLHQVSLTANFSHPTGVFAQWESAWYRQSNRGYTPALAGADLWQHNFEVGYRFPRRAAELRLGVLNLFDRDYRLNPLNLHADLPRQRMLVTSLRLNF